MKTLLLSLFLLGTIKSNGQTKHIDTSFYLNHYAREIPVWNKIWCVNYSGDTLLLNDVSSFHFIKLGDKIYKIETTLTEVKVNIDSVLKIFRQ